MRRLRSLREPQPCGSIFTILCTLATLMAAARPARAEVTVGRLARGPIVIAADATPAEKHAADELRDFVARATGTRPEIITAGGAQDAGIFLGKASRARTGDLGGEGFPVVIGRGPVDNPGPRARRAPYCGFTLPPGELRRRLLPA